MKLSLAPNSIAANINKIVANKYSDSHSLEITVEILGSNAVRRNTSTDKSIFVLASTNPDITNAIVQNNNKIVPYLMHRLQSDHVITARSTLASRSKQKAYIKKLHIQKNTISNLTVFAGVFTERSTRRRKTGSLLAVDTLVVLKNGGPLENNILLFEDKQKTSLWTGGAFQDNSGQWYKKTTSPVTQADFLYVTVVPNTKVIYQSELNESLFKPITNTFNDFFSINKKINSKQAIINKIKTQTRNYFSPLYYAKTSNNTLPLSFTFNRLDFFRNNGAFSKLIKNENEMINSFELLETKIIRKRIIRNNPSNRLTGAPATKDFDGTVEVLRDPISYPNLMASNDVLTVATADSKMAEITDGNYLYGVEFTFLDNTREKLLNAISDPNLGLSVTAKRLEDLYQEMLQSDNYNVYSKSLSASYTSRYLQENKEAILLGSIESYVSVLSLFHKNLALSIGSTSTGLVNRLFMMSNPLINGPEGISGLLRIIVDLVNQLRLFAGTQKPLGSTDAAVLNMQTSKLGSGARLLKIEHYFDMSVDADDTTDNGFDYLTSQQEASSTDLYSPFRLLTYQQLQNLQSGERAKYNNLANTATSPVSLSPNYFSISNKLYKINSTDPNQEETDAVIATSILAANKYRNSPINFQQFNVNDDTTGSPTGILSILKNNLKVIEKEDCSVSVNFHDDADNIFAPLGAPLYPATAANHLDAAEVLSEQSPFVINKSGSTSLQSFIQHTINNISQEHYYTDIQRLNNDLLSYLVQTDYYSDSQEIKAIDVKNITDKKVFASNNVNLETFRLRNLQTIQTTPSTAVASVNTLLLGQAAPQNTLPQELNYANYISSPISASQITSVALKYGNIRKIQYLAGFRKLNDSVMMKEPLWIDLSNATLDNFSAAGKTIMCRLAKSYSEFADYNGTKAPHYDEVFILSPSSPTSAPTAGNVGFPILSDIDTTALKNLSSMEQPYLKYSTSPPPEGVLANKMPTQITYQMMRQNQRAGLYTNGKDFLLPNGNEYIGYYHIHRKDNGQLIAMAGRRHTPEAHEVLKPVTDQARAQMRAGSATGTGGSQQNPSVGTSGY
jgi:hypothetical protein